MNENDTLLGSGRSMGFNGFVFGSQAVCKRVQSG